MTQHWSRALLDVQIASNADIERARAAMKRVADEVWHEDGAILEEPEVVGVTGLGPGWIIIRLIAKTRPLEQWRVNRLLRERIKDELDQEGIALPAPTPWIGPDQPLGARAPRPCPNNATPSGPSPTAPSLKSSASPRVATSRPCGAWPRIAISSISSPGRCSSTKRLTRRTLRCRRYPRPGGDRAPCWHRRRDAAPLSRDERAAGPRMGWGSAPLIWGSVRVGGSPVHAGVRCVGSRSASKQLRWVKRLTSRRTRR